jgi:hypothetical protein
MTFQLAARFRPKTGEIAQFGNVAAGFENGSVRVQVVKRLHTKPYIDCREMVDYSTLTEVK